MSMMTRTAHVFTRKLVSDPGNPGGCDAFGGWPWPPDCRWETDEEVRERIKNALKEPRE